MKKHPTPANTLLQFMLRAQHIVQREGRADEGYAMLLVSIVSILLFALLSASMTLSNLARAQTNAYVDGQSSFYVAEAGLNARASDFVKIVNGYSGVSGVTVPNKDVLALTPCYNIAIPTTGRGATAATGTDDFECRNYGFQSSNNASQVASGKDISLGSGGQNQYIAYTVVADLTKYTNGVASYITIPPGDAYAGLNASEYKYRIYATAQKPVTLPTSSLPTYTDTQKAAIARCQQGQTLQTGDSTICSNYNAAVAVATAAGAVAQSQANGGSNVTLSADFTSRAIPLFQFGILYDGDMELNSTSPMQINGWVHSNGNIYVQPAGVTGSESQSVTTFLDRVTAAGSIYNRVDAFTPVGRYGITRVLLTGTDYTCATGCGQFTAYSTGITAKLTASQINAINTIGSSTYTKVQDNTTGAIALKTPPTTFARKRNYYTNKIGTYFAQADMRLEMVPDRDVTSKPVNAPWIRNQAIIPFNFTAITTGGTGTCTTTAPTAGNDPANNYVDPTREKVGTLHCNVFTKGQLQSLRQPIMVLTNINQPNTAYRDPALPTATTPNPATGKESQTLGRPAFPTSLPVLSTTANTLAVQKKIVRALQVALVSTPKPVPYEKLDTAFNDPAYVNTSGTYDANLYAFKQGFSNLINGIAELSSNDRDTLLGTGSNLGLTPKQIAALAGAWFLPAPIQRVEKNNTDTTDAATNLRSSGFYDGREQRWITMLQTNIASLSVWNRDGVYVNATDTTLTTAYQTTTANQLLAFNDAIAATPSTNITDGLAFDRAPADSTKPVGSLQSLGLGSNDTTEGGLVFHATVSDDLNGDGVMNSNDVTQDTTLVYKKNPDGTNYTDANGNTVVIDYLRTYPGTGTTATKNSPFAFAFNGGDYLPNALMLSSDQAIYVQGNFNNNGATASNTQSGSRLPAAIIADTITVLSNECVSLSSLSVNKLNIHLGQLKCGIPTTIPNPTLGYDQVGNPMTINAAFLSNTQVSNGNLGAGRYDGVAANIVYSGGANNYIRLLEDWYGSGNPYALNYYGSLISLGTPLEYSGAFKAGGIDSNDPTDTAYYNVPQRNFNFDPNFKDARKLPPLTPKVTYTIQNNFRHTF